MSLSNESPFVFPTPIGTTVWNTNTQVQEFVKIGQYPGITLRQLYAGMAMMAMSTIPESLRSYTKESIAKYAVERADELIRELEK